eukprot:CAMPEP_0181353614 /NCGR_PEP_ID=MMETSP1106-20121128/2924_1 /TAXON_ID=81844 /ORGANISM="Mantoniella antarctica, Strain SL-175" /LENGTH=391 /DNA_ID=CAMNT_0023466227 /DNA_START=50 /DNA_END=1225 /DNA_ORIENTATION=-
MVSPPTRAHASWHVERATSLRVIWARIAVFSGPVGAWRLTGVCRAAREGVKEHLRSLPGLVVIYEGTETATRKESDVWRLDLASLQWESMPALVTARIKHACCAVGGSVAVIGGDTLVGDEREYTTTASVEALSSREGAVFVTLPPLSCGGIWGAAAIAVEAGDSGRGQVLLLGGGDPSSLPLSTVQLLDLATGVCTPQPHLLRLRKYPAAAQMPDGRVVCAGGIGGGSSVEMWGPPDGDDQDGTLHQIIRNIWKGLLSPFKRCQPEQGVQDAACCWTELPTMSTTRYGCGGCVMSDGRFAVLGGEASFSDEPMSSCEALTIGDSTHWEPIPPMHDTRTHFACVAMAGCIIVAGGVDRTSAEVFDEVLGRWLRLPHDLPHVSRKGMSGTLL